ncbi:uncharacterized protein K02A2.6-like [Culex quinquefasciatus]|uniref:uncharacterized protein K02A2.6-like n=1 Tax=Culex quinquefasciatus TaxID=7176 RepID=UPI0018E38786|nr:uncharacterized protein K02A2.6-like [Culex quinquefasciatus]
MHYARDCSIKAHECTDCGLVSHKEGYCRSAEKVRKKYVSTKVVKVNTCSVEDRRKYVPVVMNRTSVRLQLDTGSDITIISTGTWRSIGSPPMSTTSVVAKTATGKPLEIDGEFWCEMVVGGRKSSGLVRVTSQPLNLLGSDTIDSFGLWSVPLDTICHLVETSTTTTTNVDALKAEFPHLFSGELGLCVKTKVKLELKPEKSPVFRPKRPVAYAMYQAVDEELDRLERCNIISPVDFSEWAAPIVVVRKASGAVRICGDYSTGLNDALQPNQYRCLFPGHFASLASCTVFSQIDLTDAYLQVEMDESSRAMLTVNTHRGLYQYNRLAPGVKPAPGAFQQVIDGMLSGLVRTCGYLDDVVVGGLDEEDHKKNLRAVLQCIEEFGFTIRAEKCSFGQPQIRYLGHLLDRQGLRPDPAKIEAIANLAVPTDVSGVRSFLGAFNYYGKFVANMRNLRYPLDELLKDGNKFRWTPECQQAFDRFKQILSSDLYWPTTIRRRRLLSRQTRHPLG